MPKKLGKILFLSPIERRWRESMRLIVAGLAILLASSAQGAGFYLQELGTPHSLGTAGVANATNTQGADASWSNPAGMVYI